MDGGRVRLLIGLETRQNGQEIAGFNGGGAVSGGRDLWAEEQGKVTSARRQLSALTGGAACQRLKGKKERGAGWPSRARLLGRCWAEAVRACGEKGWAGPGKLPILFFLTKQNLFFFKTLNKHKFCFKTPNEFKLVSKIL